MASRGTGDWSISLLGASTLQGKELKAVFHERKLPVRRMQFIDTDDAQGLLTEFEGEPAIIQPVTSETFLEKDLAIFAADSAFTSRHWRQASECGCRIIDLSYSLETESQAECRAPLIEHLWQAAPNGKGRQAAPGTMAVSAHPVAIALAGVLKLLSQRGRLVRAAATVFEPASERGQAGVEELHQQTVSLLSFQEIPKKVFDAQVSFNLLTGMGEQSQPALRQGQERIASQLGKILRGSAPQPALRLLQAPVFHCYSFNCWVEMAKPLDTSDLECVLDQEPFSLRRAPEEQPTVISAANSDAILLGAIECDAAHEAGYWIWGVFDNLRIAALNTQRIAQDMMGLADGAVSSLSGGAGAGSPRQS